MPGRRPCDYAERWAVARALHRAIDGFLARGLCRIDLGTLCRTGRDGRPFWEGRTSFEGSDGEWAVSGHTGESEQHTAFLFDVAYERAPRRVCEVGFNVGHSAVTLLSAAGDNASYLGFDLSVLNPGSNEEIFEMLRGWLGEAHRLDMRWGDVGKTLPRYLEEDSGASPCDLLFYDGPHDALSVLRFLPLLRHLAGRWRPLIVIDDVRCGGPLCAHGALAWDFLVWSGLIRELRCQSARSLHAAAVGHDFGACVGEFQRGPRAASCAAFDARCVLRTLGATDRLRAWRDCCLPRADGTRTAEDAVVVRM